MGRGVSRARAFVGFALIASVAGCGGGGGGSDVSISFGASTASLSEGAGPTALQVVLHTTLPALDADASVDVVDAGTGTASSGADYTAFVPQTITFPAGSLDGATQTVTLEPLDDSLVDGVNETARLRLQNASETAISGPSQLTATITDIHSAQVGFASAGSATSDESSGPDAVALELECGAGVTLGLAVSVRVSDLRTGSASVGSDYSSFPAQTVTFPAGSADGAVVTVNVSIKDDGSVEGDETVELGLSSPSSCTLGATAQHELTITDDDSGGPAAFIATEGPAGTGNALAYDEALALGTVAVGAGPNTGTLVRVANGGGASMTLGAPRLAGSHPNDFYVDIESSTAPLDDGTRGLAAGPEPAPLIPVQDGGPGLALRIDAAELAHMSALQEVVLHDFALPDLGPVTLELRRRELPLAPDALLLIDGQPIDGGVRTLTGELQVWSGQVAGVAGSRVFLALTGESAQGFVELPDGPERFVHFVADGPGLVRAVGEGELAALGFPPPAEFCAGERFVPGRPIVEGLSQDDSGPGTSALTMADCRVAFETDWQLYQKFGSSSALTDYVTALVAAVSEQYVTDVQTTLSIAYLGIHTSSNDGWSTQEIGGANCSDLLNELVEAWTPGADHIGSWPVTADLAHFLSGVNLGGGIAYVNALCSPGYGFGVSANMNAAINWGSWTGNAAAFTWDFVVVAHEIGHNFGSQHTHDYCPPLDKCYSNCTLTTACTRGTLMSYCHLNCGGLADIDLYFHPVCANIMRANVNSSCLGDASLAAGDYVQYRVRFNPLTTTGARSATLEWPHDATNVTQPFRVQLSGTAN